MMKWLKCYPAITDYGVFITPAGGYIFSYEEDHTVKRPLSRRKNLNVQACAILEYCTGTNTVEDIVHLLEKKFEDIPPDLFSDVESFLEDAFQKGYIMFSDKPVQSEGFIQGSIDYYVPSQILLETTTRCNLRCEHCLLCAGEPLNDELPAEEFIPVLEQFYDMGVKRVNLSGGEILTKKGWDILAAFCTSRFSSNVLTNGTLITEEIADTMMGCQEVHISLYGKDAATHERISGLPGSFERTVKGITLLTKRGTRVGCSLLMVPFNLHQLEAMIQLTISLKCTAVRVGVVSPLGRARGKDLELTESQREWLDKKMEELKTKYKEIDIQWDEESEEELEESEELEKVDVEEHNCGAGYTKWTVTSNGDVYPCGIFRVPIGNVVNDDPVNICRSPAVKFLQKLRPPHQDLCGDCSYIHACGKCHAQAFVHSYNVDDCHWMQQFETAPQPLQRIWEEYKMKK